MIYINNADSPYSEQRVSVGGGVYTLVFKFNTRNKSWYLSIYDASKTTVIQAGLQLKPNSDLTGRYIIDGLTGSFWCIRVKNDTSPINRDNLGRNKSYRLVWVNDSEAEQLREIIT